MKLYLHDDTAARELVVRLRKAGHEVVIPLDCGMVAKADPLHLLYALGNDRVLLSRNYRDFTDLHDLVIGCGGRHCGIILVRADNDRKRDMFPPQIVTALNRVQGKGLNLISQLVILNQWR